MQVCSFEELTISISTGVPSAKLSYSASRVHAFGKDPIKHFVCFVPLKLRGRSKVTHGLSISICVWYFTISAFDSAISFCRVKTLLTAFRVGLYFSRKESYTSLETTFFPLNAIKEGFLSGTYFSNISIASFASEIFFSKFCFASDTSFLLKTVSSGSRSLISTTPRR